MAQFFTDFNEYTTNTTPGDWSTRWNTASATWLITESNGSKFLRNTINTQDDRLLAWDDIGDVADAEILVKCRMSNVTGYQNTVHIRTRGTGSNKYSYYFAFDRIGGTNRFYFEQWRANVYYTIQNVAKSYAANEWWWMRLSISGRVFRGRAWKDGTSEPGTWDINYTDNTGTYEAPAGAISLAGYNAEGVRDFDQFSVGTGGDQPLMYFTQPVISGTTDIILRNIVAPTQDYELTNIGGGWGATVGAVNYYASTPNPLIAVVTLNSSVDMILYRQIDIAGDTDILLHASYPIPGSTDVITKKAYILTGTSDVIARKQNSVDATTDLLLRSSNVLEGTSDLYLLKQEVISGTTDVVVLPNTVFVLSGTVDTILRELQTVDVEGTTDTLLRAQVTQIGTTDIALNKIFWIDSTTDMILAGRVAADGDIDLILKSEREVNGTADVIARAVNEVSGTSDVVLYYQGLAQASIDAILRKTDTLYGTTDLLIYLPQYKTGTIDTSLICRKPYTDYETEDKPNTGYASDDKKKTAYIQEVKSNTTYVMDIKPKTSYNDEEKPPTKFKECS